MTLKYNILTTVFLLFSGVYIVKAQQTPVFSDYNYNAFILNPAHAGLYTDAELVLSSHGVGTSVEGSPETHTLSYNTSLNRGKMGLGGGILSDRIGVTRVTKLFASYSYKINLGYDNYQPRWFAANPQIISFGLTAGVLSYNEDLQQLGVPNNDPEFDENIRATIPIIGIGFLFNRRNLYFGASLPNVLGNSLASNKNINLHTPFYAYFGYRFFADNIERIMIKPNTLLKYEEGVPLQLDLNVLISYKQKIEAGLGYRSASMFNFLVGFYAFNNLRLTYSYNQQVQSSPVSNVHGVSLSYRFGKGYHRML